MKDILQDFEVLGQNSKENLKAWIRNPTILKKPSDSTNFGHRLDRNESSNFVGRLESQLDKIPCLYFGQDHGLSIVYDNKRLLFSSE
ncbi:hypothetical protein SUGI_0070930 [Cryptomeria japonica]|nr:hypothetical protein SUGI_0070930 [Cryptomeria japonica]